MTGPKNPWSGWKLLAAAAAAAAVLLTGLRVSKLREKSPVSDLGRYDYRDTRQLVALTGRAAALVGKEGEKSFRVFRANPDDWSVHGDSYLYVYDLDNVNLFHGGYPQLAGRNLGDFTDLLGKKPGQLIIEQLERYPGINPHGWSHYLWVAPGALNGVWKASCNFKVTMPDGREVFVGSGIDNPLPEREFYRIIVDEAARLLERKGRAALDDFKSPRGAFTIYNRGVFVIGRDGRAVIDSGMNLFRRRNLFDYSDFTGRHPLAALDRKLQSADSAWVVMLTRENANSTPVKKGIYGRRARMGKEEVMVGAICPLPRPAWMRQ